MARGRTAEAAAVAVAVVAAAVLLLLPARTAAARTMSTGITCTLVDVDMAPCLMYIRNGGTVPGSCCDGLKSLVAAAQTVDDRRAACNCLKTLAQGASKDELARAEQLPGICKVPIPYRFSPDTDCSKIN
ncbi:Non-specific lipid-transfer protein [Apostasia shenzhenica]|uniref:Non-specific lipid-transfer protein n=1 Tax=Apostasia shenzhenica TaxID=1088818 RepID=A0A2I0A8K7_9ASPA|nr:Non-specific lipid-transfer protein [Apostasia shenzhenica]